MADSKETIICPACGKEMDKIFLADKKFNIDICLNGCGGIFFDNREFKKFDEQDESIDEIINLLRDKKFTKTNESLERKCPNCYSVMIKNATKQDGETIIDECYTCGAKFLDNGELEKIREEFKTEEERSKDFHNSFLNTYGMELSQLDMQNRRIRKENSYIRRKISLLFKHDII